MYFVDYKHVKFNNWYVYPDWASALGWIMALTSFVVLILTMVGQMCQTTGSFIQVGVVKIPPCTFIVHIIMTHFFGSSVCPSFAGRPKSQPGGGRQLRTREQLR